MKPRNLRIVRAVLPVLWSCLGAGCDGFLGPEPQFNRYSIKSPWPCGADGPHTPAPLAVYVMGKAIDDNAFVNVDVHDLPFGQPVSIFGVLQHPGPADTAAWLARCQNGGSLLDCEVSVGEDWRAIGEPVVLHWPAQEVCPAKFTDPSRKSEQEFRLTRYFDGPLGGKVTHAEVYAETGPSATQAEVFRRNLTIRFVDPPSHAQLWPKGPLKLVPGPGHCGDAFLLAVNPGQGHAPAPGLMIEAGSTNFTVHTLYYPVGSDPKQGPPALLKTSSGAISLPAGWQLDPQQAWIWHVRYCGYVSGEPVATQIAALDDPSIRWTVDTAATDEPAGCLRLAQGEPLDLSDDPWPALMGKGGLRLDLVNVCEDTVSVEPFQAFGSTEFTFSATPFAADFLATNFASGTKVKQYHSLPLYVRHHLDQLNAPQAISASLHVSQGKAGIGQFQFTAHKP